MWRFFSRHKGLVLLATAVIAGAPGFLAWQHFYPVTAADGWSYRVYLDQPQVSALARDRQGTLYVSQELSSGRGVLFRQAPDGHLSPVLTGLAKPDGLASLGDGVAISQEGGEQPVLWLRDGKAEVLFRAINVEGIASDGSSLYAIEDRPGDGRLLRFALADKSLTVLRAGLLEGEGVAVCPDGQLFYAEKGRNWVKRFKADGGDETVLAGLKAPGFLMCDEAGLWVSEDATHRARLLLRDNNGQLQVILSGLRSAQTVLALATGHLLVAEQGRGRVLEVRHAPNRGS